MAEGEPLLKDLFVQDEYRVVRPDLPMPKAAAIFAETPGTPCSSMTTKMTIS